MSNLHAERLYTTTLGRFLIAGGVSYLVNQGALFVLYEYAFDAWSRQVDSVIGRLDPALVLASVLALEVSILVRFVVNDRWTFRDRRQRRLAERFAQFNLSSFGSPLVSLAAVNILTPQLGISYLIANSIGILLGLGWNWLWSNRVIWAARNPAPLATRHS